MLSIQNVKYKLFGVDQLEDSHSNKTNKTYNLPR